jgi:hypothetical protein
MDVEGDEDVKGWIECPESLRAMTCAPDVPAAGDE